MAESGERYTRVPEELKELRQWVIWGVNEKAKIPYTPIFPPVEAKANDSSTWGGFTEAVDAAARLGRGGIGIEFGEPCGVAGIDLDDVINEAGELAEWASEIVDTMDSYTELSPSGRGLHILFMLSVPYSEICARNRDSKLGIEIYDTGRYFTVTGQVYGEAKGLKERTEALKEVCAKYLAAAERRKQQTLIIPNEGKQYSSIVTSFEKKSSSNSPEKSSSNSPEKSSSNSPELWERMFESVHGREIRALNDGDVSCYGSHSEADLALCNHLAYWTGNDARRMDEMFRASGLMREKWDESRGGGQTYGEMTIARAIEDTRAYTPPVRVEREASTAARSNGTKSNSATGNASPIVEAERLEARNIERLKPVSEYLIDFMQELLKSREGKGIPTGFPALDKLLDGGLYPGLYFVGAISALGKTTLALQIADNIAKSGYGVLIISLEMSRTELMAKTLSRESLLKDLEINDRISSALSTRGILRASFSGQESRERILQEAIKEYEMWGRNIMIIEGIGDVGVSTVREYVDGYMKAHEGQPPVIVIDYLQILAPYNAKYTDKQNVDKNVLELKRLSRDYQIPVIGISSFNRENYKETVSMASFKESGAIEYSSDVLIGLQIEGIERRSGEKDSDYRERIQLLMKSVEWSKREGKPIGIEAKILKHRNGIPGSIHLEFYSRYNYFREALTQTE